MWASGLGFWAMEQATSSNLEGAHADIINIINQSTREKKDKKDKKDRLRT